MPTIDDELVQNAKAVFNSTITINSAKDLKTKDGSSIGGSGDSANWINYHVEIKAGGPVTISDPVNIGTYDIFQYYSNSANAFSLTTGEIPSESYNIGKSCTINKEPKAYTPALLFNYFAKVDKLNKIIRFYTTANINSSAKNAFIYYRSNNFKWSFKNPSLIMPGDYTLTVTYGIGSDNVGEDGLYHITSDLNNTKFHMIVEEDTAGNKTIKGAEGVNGMIHEYIPSLGSYYVLYLVDVQLAPGWTA